MHITASGKYWRMAYRYIGYPITRVALALSALLFQRPGNIRQFEWAWVDFDKAMITIPAEFMQQRRLAMQAWATYLDTLCTGADVIVGKFWQSSLGHTGKDAICKKRPNPLQCRYLTVYLLLT